jgi:PAS domain S-box-containing protein
MSTAQEELIRCTEFLERFNKLRTIPDWIAEVERALDELLGMEYSGLYLYNEALGKLELLVAKGFTEKERLAAEMTAMERHPGKVFHTGEGWYIPNVLNDPAYTTTDSDRSFLVRSRLYQPIRVEGKVVGVFGAVSSKVDAFNPMERELFKFLIQLSATIYLRIRTEQTNKELNAIKDRLSFIATHTDNMVILTNAQQQIDWVNAAFEKVTGHHLHEIAGLRPGDLLQRSDIDQAAKARMKAAIVSGESCVERVVNYTKHGLPYHVEVQIYPIKNASGQVTHFISLQRDITERKKLEAERDSHMLDLEQAIADVKSRNDRLHNFSNVLSHNIRSHTSNIMALVKLIQMHPLPDGAVKFFEVLDRSVHNLDETIRNLNSTISSNIDPRVDKEEVDLTKLLSKIRESLSVDIDEANVTLDCRCEECSFLWADKALLESIVTNLITNAIKYRSKNRVPIVKIESELNESAYVLRVSDNGQGIDLNRHGNDIFGMYKTFNSEGKGQGIGLYLTRNQVDMMGGSIAVESALEVGTTFTVKLPRNGK